MANVNQVLQTVSSNLKNLNQGWTVVLMKDHIIMEKGDYMMSILFGAFTPYFKFHITVVGTQAVVVDQVAFILRGGIIGCGEHTNQQIRIKESIEGMFQQVQQQVQYVQTNQPVQQQMVQQQVQQVQPNLQQVQQVQVQSQPQKKQVQPQQVQQQVQYVQPQQLQQIQPQQPQELQEKNPQPQQVNPPQQ